MEQPDLELKGLSQFYGTMEYHNVLGVSVTDGVKYLMENGYSWLVTDAIAVMKFDAKLKKEPFLSVKLKQTAENEADLIIEDGNGNILYRQHYDFTDAKKDLSLFYTDNVLMLNNEY